MKKKNINEAQEYNHDKLLVVAFTILGIYGAIADNELIVGIAVISLLVMIIEYRLAQISISINKLNKK